MANGKFETIVFFCELETLSIFKLRDQTIIPAAFFDRFSVEFLVELDVTLTGLFSMCVVFISCFVVSR